MSLRTLLVVSLACGLFAGALSVPSGGRAATAKSCKHGFVKKHGRCVKTTKPKPKPPPATTAPAPTPTPTPTPPPAPTLTAKPGHYAGTYTDGSRFAFDVDSSGSSVANISFDFNGECPGYGTSYGSFTEPGPFGLQPDGSFTINDTATDSNQTKYAIAITGTVTSTGSASGTLRVDLGFSDGTACTSHGTWSTTDQ